MEILGLTFIMILVIAFATRDKTKKIFSPQFRNSDLVSTILGLDQQNLDKLFDLYREQFGPEAAKYARRTYLKWKSGQVRPSKKTFNRLLLCLPKVMSFDLKCELLRKLKQEYCSKDSYKLTVDTEDWRDTVAPLVTSIINKGYSAELPKHIQERLTWLSDNDAQTAQAILAESQAQEGRNAVSLLEQEFSNIEQLLVNVNGTKVSHTIKLPYGNIILKIRRR
jgi:hypothetical protein